MADSTAVLPVMAYYTVIQSYYYTVILAIAAVCVAQDDSIGSCNFSRDCDSYHYCQAIQDAGCVCNFGQCVIRGSPFFRGSQCDQYTDCDCRNTPETCFCQDGYCKETRWECHEKTDCARLSKCRDRDCTCSGDLCEHECDTDKDCKDFHCNTALGYNCRCENSLCAYKQKSKECRTIGDCVNQGLCQADTPCACTQEYCALPWWVQDKSTKLNCRSDKVKYHNIVLPLCNYCHDCEAAANETIAPNTMLHQILHRMQSRSRCNNALNEMPHPSFNQLDQIWRSLLFSLA